MADADYSGGSRGAVSRIAGIILLVIGAALVLFGASAKFMSWVTPTQFEARTVIRTEPGKAEGSTNSPAYGDFFFLQTEFEVARSEIVLDRVITNFDLPHAWGKKFQGGAFPGISECRRLLKEAMALKVQPGTNTIELLVRGDDRMETARIANAIAESYFEYYDRPWRERQTALTNASQAHLAELKARITAAREKMLRLKTDLDIDETAPVTASPSPTREPGIDKQFQVIKEEGILVRLRSLDRQQLRNALPGISTDSALPSLLQELNQAELNLATLNPAHENEQPEVARTRASIDELNRKIDGRVEGILLGMETHIATLKDEVKKAEAKRDEEQNTVRQTAEKQRPYYEAKREWEGLEEQRDALRAEINALMKSPKPRTVEILSRAEPPAESVPGHPLLRPLLLGVGVVFALTGLVLLIRGSQAKFGV